MSNEVSCLHLGIGLHEKKMKQTVVAAAGSVSLESYSKMFFKLNLPHTHSINLYVVMDAVKFAEAGYLLAYRVLKL